MDYSEALKTAQLDLGDDDINILSKYYQLTDVRTWYFYPIEMPITKEGTGPATIPEAHKMTYEVWDRLCNTVESFEYLPDAINLALKLNQALLGGK